MVIRQALEVALLAQVRRHRLGVGGGITSQAGAIRHGITRALMEYDPELRKACALPDSSRASARSRTQEGRPPQGASWTAVLQALIFFEDLALVLFADG